MRRKKKVLDKRVFFFRQISSPVTDTHTSTSLCTTSASSCEAAHLYKTRSTSLQSYRKSCLEHQDKNSSDGRVVPRTCHRLRRHPLALCVMAATLIHQGTQPLKTDNPASNRGGMAERNMVSHETQITLPSIHRRLFPQNQTKTQSCLTSIPCSWCSGIAQNDGVLRNERPLLEPRHSVRLNRTTKTTISHDKDES